MKDKKTVLIRVAYLIDLPSDAIDSDNDILDNISNELSENIRLNEEDLLLEWESTSSLVLDPSSFNCGRCSNCGRWTTDREKDEYIPSLCNGATVDGKLLCDECLPSDHPYAF